MVIKCLGGAAPQVQETPATVTIGHDDGCHIPYPEVVKNFPPEKTLRQICTRRLNKRRNLHPSSDQLSPSVGRGQEDKFDDGWRLT
ncbi:hypothetical protein [Arthrobacter sp. H14-L1]|uniref:hypothetical protein n=1 Tax=Arthrobacter sp. H14-L1 TaxID=2996697 RepID=UPI002271F13B|nr:hypothetical protein [Arthrobacter sp. H14-L1]MCY0903667.1 hypothetical protein [Arthrobacter sp. H14-L1]